MGIWLKRFWKTGARFDTVQWAEKVCAPLAQLSGVGATRLTTLSFPFQASFWTHGSLTFREAYERTGRVLNVSVIPHDRHSPTKLLNVRPLPDPPALPSARLTTCRAPLDSISRPPTASSGRPSSRARRSRAS